MKRYAKGEERRLKLILAAERLLENEDLPEITMHRIAAEADIPPGSAYHFFSGANEVFAAAAGRFGEQLIQDIISPYSGAALESWSNLFEHAARRGVALYQSKPGYCRLILGSTTAPSIKASDRQNDFELGAQFAELMNEYFVLPEINQCELRFFHAIEIFDLFLSLSFQRHGALTPEMIEDGLSASISYLRQFIPDRIPRRGV
ncbi:TetR family transcriptional regulator [Tropicibacter sp. R16_0]|uniref:TetR/AcrR family transcriptional regulator n=1 Tax=Tropicibacter sp. R16_0 TaxID=2821102 RepID=UPI001ADD0DF5|nr:TetR/AcrR family transcriptional regulator [Tropicibacter sp. R16_0]MBO9449912.1 TetR family transcriptional regulator [Tropicibacter sp. R16_0]